MPTGYTAQIEDGKITNAKDFLLLCTRAFGVAIDLKGEPLSTPTPMEFEPDEYYKINLQRREQELEESKQMTIDEFIEREKHSMQRSAEFAREHIKEMKSANKRYLRIREVISKWNPPTTSHEGLKEFALEQIDKSIYSEDYFSWSEKIIEHSNTVRSQVEWNDLFDEYIKAAEEDVKRAKKRYDDAVELARRNTSYMKMLIESISDIDIDGASESNSK